MTTKRLIAASLSALTLAACTSTPVPREAAGSYSEGYTERPLSANRYLVSYRMDGSDYQRAYDLALWRAAQVSLEKGYPTFEVVSRDSDTELDARPTTSFTTHHAIAYQRSCGLLSCTTRATPTTWSELELNAGRRRQSRVVSLEVMFMREAAGGSSNRYDAASVVDNSKLH